MTKKLWLKTKSSGARIVFTEFIYLQFFFVCLFSVLFNCQHCSVHNEFCKGERNTCSVVSTLNMSLANKRFNV